MPRKKARKHHALEDCPDPAECAEHQPQDPEDVVDPDAEDPGTMQRSLVPKKAHRGLEFGWKVTAKASLVDQATAVQKAYPRARKIRLEGTYIDTSVNLNQWAVPASELASIARQLSSGKVQLRLDHSEGVRDVIGKFTRGILRDADGAPINLDAGEDATNRANRVDFEAEMTTEDPDVAIPILQGYVEGVSPNLLAGQTECGICGKNAWPLPTCEHFPQMEDTFEESMRKTGWYLLRDVNALEGSIVATPAYEDRTPFLPVGFAAGLEKALGELKHMANDKPSGAPAGAPPGDAGAGGYQAALAAKDETIALMKAQNEAFQARLAALEKQVKANDSTDEEEEKKKAKAKADAEAEAKKAEADAKKKAEAEAEAKKQAAVRAGAQIQNLTPAQLMVQRPYGAMAGSLQDGRREAVERKAMGEMFAAAHGGKTLGRMFEGELNTIADTGGH